MSTSEASKVSFINFFLFFECYNIWIYEIKSNKSEPAKKSKENYEFIKVIGEGSFSTVHLAKDKKSGSLFASMRRIFI